MAVIKEYYINDTKIGIAVFRDCEGHDFYFGIKSNITNKSFYLTSFQSNLDGFRGICEEWCEKDVTIYNFDSDLEGDVITVDNNKAITKLEIIHLKPCSK